MNKLPISKRVEIIEQLVEGMSLQATSRVTDVSINTVMKLLVDVGRACQDFHNAKIVGVNSQRIQCNEIWSFVHSKQESVEKAVVSPDDAGDVWTWTGIDVDSKLIVSWFVGNRDTESVLEFMQDIKNRIGSRIQLMSNGYKPYLGAVNETIYGHIDFAQLVKVYGSSESEGNERQYSEAEFVGTRKIIIEDHPNVDYISTSFVECQSLTIPVHVGLFTRLTSGFSKKIENHCYAVALHFVYYNFCKIHKTLRVTPAMEAKLVDRPMSIQQIVELSDRKN